jgi:hypothetical protein
VPIIVIQSGKGTAGGFNVCPIEVKYHCIRRLDCDVGGGSLFDDYTES